MLFNVEYCQILHIRHNIIMAKYEINGNLLEQVSEERTHGVVILSNLKCSRQCLQAVKTALRVPGMHKRSSRWHDSASCCNGHFGFSREMGIFINP